MSGGPPKDDSFSDHNKPPRSPASNVYVPARNKAKHTPFDRFRLWLKSLPIKSRLVRFLRSSKSSAVFTDMRGRGGLPYYRTTTSFIPKNLRRWIRLFIVSGTIVLIASVAYRCSSGPSGPVNVTSNHWGVTVAPEDEEHRIDVKAIKEHTLNGASIPRYQLHAKTNSSDPTSRVFTLEYRCLPSDQTVKPGWSYLSVLVELRHNGADPATTAPRGSGTIVLLTRVSVKDIPGREDVKALHYEVYHDKQEWDGLQGPSLDSIPKGLPSARDTTVDQDLWTRKIHTEFANQYQKNCVVNKPFILQAAAPQNANFKADSQYLSDSITNPLSGTGVSASGSRSRPPEWRPTPDTAAYASSSLAAAAPIPPEPCNPFTDTYGKSLSISLGDQGGLA